ncbi:MAG: hypothetical protein H0T62_13155 [Parachlamydiaceae bacterium]|nr:hypothetical protein [Parachlamydiaceae bacterium]
MIKGFLLSFLIFLFIVSGLSAEENFLFLRDNLGRAQPGDFIVTAQGKNYSLLHIQYKDSNQLTIEEISIPAAKVPRQNFLWRTWASQGFAGNSSRVLYTVDLANGQLKNFFSFTRGSWYEMSAQNNFFPTLLNLRFNYISEKQRRRIGVCLVQTKQDKRPFWQPKMVVEGNEIQGVDFDAWKAQWPKDGTDLSGKTIEVYLPKKGMNYPSYFPYWLQISGLVGSAKVRIIDSGSGLTTPLSLPYTFKKL